jgi:predicted nuclease of restriction endonuclease-like (RecB) superfamily
LHDSSALAATLAYKPDLAARHQIAKGSSMAKLKQSKTDLAIKRIRDFYYIGKASLRKCPGRAQHAEHQLDEEAEQLKMNPFTLRKARQFADVDRGYSGDDIEELCRQIEKQGSAPGQTTFGRTHIVRLIGVPKSKRLELQQLAITNGWSTSQLSSQITMRFGRRRLGGRRIKIPKNLHGVYAQIEGLCGRWQRWSIELAKYHHGTLAKMPDEIQTLIETSAKLMQRIKEKVTTQIGTKWSNRKFAKKIT